FAFELMCTLTVPGKPGTNCSMNSVGTLLIGQANNAANPTLQTVGAQWATPIMIGAPQTAVAFDPTVAQFVEMSSTWSATTGAPRVTLRNFSVFAQKWGFQLLAGRGGGGPTREGTQPAALTWTGAWTAAQTTASFTPESGALLVALVSGDGAGGATPTTASV